MDRVVGPLREMGAAAGWPPLRVGGNVRLRGIVYQASFPSAQVKSALLLAGLYAEGVTAVAERVRTRDHTERMLVAMAAAVTETSEAVEVGRTERLEPLDMTVPGDFSSAAFWLVAGGLVAGSAVRLRGVGVNPTRTAFADALTSAGIHVDRARKRLETGEPQPFNVDAIVAPRMIDELPVLAVAATQAIGTSVIAGAGELRIKESDRLAAIEGGLRAMGADITATEDGWVIKGPRHLEGARVDSAGDHRVAMALAVAGLVADGTTEIEGAECVDISYPGFFDDLESLA